MRYSSSIIFAAILIATVSCLSLRGQPPQVSGYAINWYDEFDGNGLDTFKWTPIFSTNPTNQSLHAYLPENVTVAGGNLIILSTDQPFGNFQYRSGQVISTAAQRYGRFEVRGKLPTSRGMWPAIWLLPDAPWPSQGEIDIMENRGDQPFLTSSAFHWGTNPPFEHFFVYREQETFVDSDAVNYHDSFHTYAAEWDPTQIRYYVDGVHYHTVRDGQVGSFLTGSQTAPMNLIINTAIGGTFLANPDNTTQWPQLFEVDYAYVYNRVGDATLQLENGGFDFSASSLSNWTLFGNFANNVRAVSNPTESATGALKLYGQFTSGTNYSGVEQGVTVTAGDEIEVKCRVFVDSADTIAGTGNEAFLKFDFYNTNYGEFGSNEYISSESVLLANSGTPNDHWLQRTLSATVPEGAVEARVAIVFAQSNSSSGSVFVDSLQFENFSEVQELDATSFLPISGQVVSGDVESTHESDNGFLRILATAAGKDVSPVDVIFETSTSELDPAMLRLDVEVAANTTNLNQVIQALNHETGLFEVLSTDPVALQDLTVTADFGNSPTRFVRQSDGKIIVRLSYEPAGPVLMFPWRVRLDAVHWQLTQ